MDGPSPLRGIAWGVAGGPPGARARAGGAGREESLGAQDDADGHGLDLARARRALGKRVVEGARDAVGATRSERLHPRSPVRRPARAVDSARGNGPRATAAAREWRGTFRARGSIVDPPFRHLRVAGVRRRRSGSGSRRARWIGLLGLSARAAAAPTLAASPEQPLADGLRRPGRARRPRMHDGGRLHLRRVPDGQRLLLRRHRRASHAGVSRLVDHHVDASSLPRRAVAADPPVAAAVVPGRAALYGRALQQHLPLNPSSVLDGRDDTSRSLRAWRPLAAGRVVPANPAAAPARIEASASGRTTGRQPLRVGERPMPGSNRSVISGVSRAGQAR